MSVSVIKRLLHSHAHAFQRYVFAMNKAYMRHHRTTDGPKFDISFQLIDPSSQVDRNFNFTRSLDEDVAAFLTRVNTNVEKFYVKARKKKRLAPAPALAVQSGLYINQVKIADDVPCNKVFVETNQITLKLCDREYDVVINAPFVEHVALPSTIIATFPVYPQKFQAQYMDAEHTSFTWYKSLNKLEWQRTGEGFSFTPDADSVNHFLKLECLPRNAQGNEGPLTEIVSDTVVQPSPGICPWVKRQQMTQTRCADGEFRVVTYNILSDLYCDSDYSRTVLYPYCPPHALALDYRKQLYTKEILGFNSDIVCLQEVDRKVFTNDLQPVLLKYGYTGELALKGGQVAEGVSCFYQTDKFKLIFSETVHLADSLRSNPIFNVFSVIVAENDKLKARFLDRQTVLQLVVLECRSTNNILLVANTHLYFHPDADHIRLLQAAMAMKYVENEYERIKMDPLSKDKQVGLVFCGDFNSVPSCGIYKLFTEGRIEADCADWSSSKDETVRNLTVVQPFKLGSACGTPPYTNYTTGFADCLDYIFYQNTCMEVTRSVPLPSNDDLIFHTALPSVVFPSDHISLCADFRWKN